MTGAGVKTFAIFLVIFLFAGISPVSGRPVTLVAIGDSISLGSTTTGLISPGLNSLISVFGYHTTIHKVTIKPYTSYLQAMMPNARIINVGIGNEQTGHMRARFPHDVLDQNPDYAIIQGGFNDIWYGTPVNETEDNLRSMYEMAQNNKVVPVATTVFYANSPGLSPEQEQQITELNQWILQYASDHGIPVAAFNRSFEDPSIPLRSRKELISLDGVHPNAQGYKAMAGIVYAIINPKSVKTSTNPFPFMTKPLIIKNPFFTGPETVDISG